MPELPEVETTCRGVAPYVVGNTITDVIIRERQLRWLIPLNLKSALNNTRITKLVRRAKYLLFYTNGGSVILHLGMSGSLSIINDSRPAEKHDHVDIIFSNGHCLRFRDPRKFGCILWTHTDPMQHKLICNLGIEPLSRKFHGDYLYQCSRTTDRAIKTFIMDSRIVVGIGNIYANEALFIAAIRPHKPARRISLARYNILAAAIKKTLRSALKKGGTTLQDFTNPKGKPGYFKSQLQVYGRAGAPCKRCKKSLTITRLQQRSTVYCTHCQR